MTTLRAQAPCRVDLAGGTLDIWPLYLFHDDAVTVNFAVDRYTRCELAARPDRRIVLRSRDLQAEEEFDSLAALRVASSYRLPLLAYLVRFFAPTCGFELSSDSEAPAGAGISGSSALMITIASALSQFTGAGYGPETIREVAQNVEAQIIRVPTGSQDYYPALYGGVSAMEMSPAGIRHHAVPVDHEELNRRFVLAYTGVPRNSGINNWEVMKAHIDGNASVRRNFDQIASLARAMRAALTRADWGETGRVLQEEWHHRRQNVPGITTELIDRLISVTAGAGATGAKVCGAGGGGCVFFLVEPDAKERVAALIRQEGATVLATRVAPEGVRVSS